MCSSDLDQLFPQSPVCQTSLNILDFPALTKQLNTRWIQHNTLLDYNNWNITARWTLDHKFKFKYLYYPRGANCVVKVDILPSLVYLALVFPLPPELRLALVRDIFTFLWGGHEFVRRDWMHQEVAVGGRGVPDILTGGPL